MEGQDLLLVQAILNSPYDIIIGGDLSGAITSWNIGAENAFGYSAEEVTGKPLSILFFPEQLPQEYIFRREIEKGNPVGRYHTQCRKKDGSLIHVSFTIGVVKDADGKIKGTCHIGRNITFSKTSEENTLQRIKTAEETLERMNDGFIIIDKNYRYLYLNKKVGELIGMDPSSLIGKCMWDVFPDAVNSKTYKTFHDAMEKQEFTFSMDYYPPLDLWQENHIYPTKDGLSVFIRDISIQKRAEEKVRISEGFYKAIASSIPGSVVSLFDKDFRYTLVEGDILEKLGYTKEMILGKRAEDVLPGERFLQISRNLKRVFNGESFTIDDSRNTMDTISRFAPLRDEHNEVTAAMVVVIDVTELKNANRDISRLNQELEHKVEQRTLQLAEANKELESFSYSVAHDLRAPLRVISGYSSILSEDYIGVLDEEGKRLLQAMRKNANKMSMQIDELLALSRLGRKEVNKSVVDMKDLFESAIEDLRMDIVPGCEIIVQDLHTAYADSSLLSFAVTNMVSNAIKYSKKNAHPKIEITSASENNEVIYQVKDNGVGFDMAFAGNLFGVFQRLHPSSEFEGTGVGLAIVQRIIHKHHGKVGATAEVGKGATFYFSLPLGQEII